MYLYGDCARQVERTRSGVQELVSSVNFVPPPPQRGLPCKHCHETLANEQGRGIHTRTMHSAANMRQGVRLQRVLGKEDAGRDVLPWDRAGPGRCWHVEFDHTTGVSSFTLQRKRFRNVDLEIDGFTTDNPKATRGAVKRTRYDHRTRAHAVNQLRILQESEKELWDAEHLTPLEYLETFLKIHQRVVQRLGRAGIRRFRPRGGHQKSPFRGRDYIIPYMVGKLVPNPTHHTKGLVKYVPGRGYFGNRWLHDGQSQGDSWRCQAHSVRPQDQSPRCQPAAHTTGVRKRALRRRAPHPPAIPGDILEDSPESLISKWAK